MRSVFEKRGRVEDITLMGVTKMIENNDYHDICGSLRELKRGDIEDLEFVAENTSSINVCMAILNGNFPDEVKELAEKRIANLGSEFKKIGEICRRIERLEDTMKNGHLSLDEGAELLEENVNLAEEIEKLAVRDLYELAAGSLSVHICMAIINGKHPDDVKAIAECRLEQLEGQNSLKSQKDL